MRNMFKNCGLPFVCAIALTLLTSLEAANACQEKSDRVRQAQATTSRDGKVVSLQDGALLMTDLRGEEHTQNLGKDTRMTLDGVACNPADLKAGTRIRVTASGSGTLPAIRVEAIAENAGFASNVHDGMVVSTVDDTLMMKSGAEGNEHSHELLKDARVTLDGKSCRLSDLKKGISIRVTTDDAFSAVATRIEAIDTSPAFASNVHDGTVVSFSEDTLVMKGDDGNEHSHPLAADATLILDGKVCSMTDVRKGLAIRVTTRDAFSPVAARVEALDRDGEFASNDQDGVFVSMNGNTLVITTLQGKQKYSCTIGRNAKITCDSKVCKSSDLKPGMRIRVTPGNLDPKANGQIEALDKNQIFSGTD